MVIDVNILVTIAYTLLLACITSAEMIARCENGLKSHYKSLVDNKIMAPEVFSDQNTNKQVETEVEGGTNYMEFVEEVVSVQRACMGNTCNRLCQTGLNAGTSAVALLCASEDSVQVHSFDIGTHDYAKVAQTIIDESFRNRHTITWGSSEKTLPNLISSLGENSKTYCDFTFVDGGHSRELAMSDIKNFRELSPVGSYMVVENCNSWGMAHGWGGIWAVNEAYRDAIEKNLLSHVRQVSVGPCGQDKRLRGHKRECRELCIAKVL